MIIPEPFSPIAITANILGNLAADILKHYASQHPIQNSVLRRWLESAGFIEPGFQTKVQQTISDTLEEFYKNDTYRIGGVLAFFRDPKTAQQIGDFIMDRQPFDISELQATLEKYLPAVTVILLKRKHLHTKDIIESFIECYKQVLTRQLNIPQMALMLAMVEKHEDLLVALAGLRKDLLETINSTLGNVTVNVINSSHVTVIAAGKAVTYYESNPLAEDKKQKYKNYRDKVISFCTRVLLPNIDISPSRRRGPIPLDQIYVELDIDKRTLIDDNDRKKYWQNLQQYPRWNLRDGTRPLQAVEAILESDRLMLLGAPGAGKTTIVRHVVAKLAAEEICPLPIIVFLPDLGKHLDKERHTFQQLSTQKKEAQLVNLILDQIKEGMQWLNAKQYTEAIVEAIQSHQPWMLVLDALDEVPTEDGTRQLVVEAIAATLDHYTNIKKIIITCRTEAYSKEYEQNNFDVYRILPLSAYQIQLFIEGRYSNLISEQEPERIARELAEQIEKQNLMALASNPLTLLTMLLLFAENKSLPTGRASLYGSLVNVLLFHWENQKETERLSDETVIAFRKGFEVLAYEMHARNLSFDKFRPDQIFSILEDSRVFTKGREGIRDFLIYIRNRPGLLTGLTNGKLADESDYRPLREYLAGCCLIRKPHISRKVFACVKDSAYWVNVFQLGIEYFAHDSEYGEGALDLAYALCPCVPGTLMEEQKQRAVLWSGKIAHLIGRDVILRDQAAPNGGRDYLYRLTRGLVSLLAKTSRLSVAERIEAGQILAHLGDPRFDESLWCLPKNKTMGFTLVGRGPFWMGCSDDKKCYDDELEEHLVEIPSYFIGIYPVTAGQFSAFVEDSDYQLVSREGLKALSNHPITHVTWHEALAYCNWLAERLLEWKGNPPVIVKLLKSGRWRLTLPSESEWEKAARGGIDVNGKENEMPRRVYPWGDKPEMECAHCQPPQRVELSEIAGPYVYARPGKLSTQELCAVGCFPKGASPYGVLDMSGNVWEWTCSQYRPYPYTRNQQERESLTASHYVERVIRGGSFDSSSNHIRCVRRGQAQPILPLPDCGFRLALTKR